MKYGSILPLEKNSSLNETGDQLCNENLPVKYCFISGTFLKTYVIPGSSVRKAFDQNRRFEKVGEGSCARMFFFFFFFFFPQKYFPYQFIHAMYLHSVLFYGIFLSFLRVFCILSFHILQQKRN